MKAPLPAAEPERLEALASYDILDTPREPAFDDLTRIAAYVCGTPMAVISLIDDERQWFKSAVGMDGASETPRGAELSSLAVEPLDGLFELAGPPEPVGEARYSHELFDLVVRFQQHDAATEQRYGHIVGNENPDGDAV